MDSITQAALGAAVGELLLGRRMGNRAMVWGALFGTLPDLDVLASPFMDTAQKLAHHRGASHSLIIMVLASVFSAPWLARFWKKDKISQARAGWFVFLVWSTHVLIDCFTVYGTSVLWPFSEKRVAFNNLFIIDPLYTAPLVVSLVWLAFLRTKKQQAKRRKVGLWGLGLSSGYVVLSLLAKWVASGGFEADLARRGTPGERRFEAPTPFNILLWRAVVDHGDELWVGYRSVFESRSAPVRWTVYPRNRAVFETVSKEREAATLDWFSDGWWIARPNKTGVWIADVRFGETREWGAKKDMVDSRFTFSWRFEPGAPGDRLRTQRPEVRDPKESMKRLGLRVIGRKEAWEALPRLAGIPGSFPEPLRVVE